MYRYIMEETVALGEGKSMRAHNPRRVGFFREIVIVLKMLFR